VVSGLFDVRSAPAILALADQLSADDEAELGRIVVLIRLNPWPDGIVKFAFRLGNADLVIYNDGEWNAIYRIADRTLQLLDAWKSHT
jgi:hypothetical protein